MSGKFIQFIDDKSANRQALADGVRGLKCIEVRPVTWDEEMALLESVTVPGAWVSSVEVYDNGSMNAYVRTGPGPAVGFVQVRGEV